MKKHSQDLKLKKYIGALLVLLVVCFLVFKFAPNFSSKNTYLPIKAIAIHSNGSGFSGSEVCAECHLNIYDSHIKTAHYKSSAKANLESVKGSFEANDNIFHLNNSFEFRMHTRNDSLYQDIFSKSNDSLIKSSRFDAVIGSGTKGQSYLSWQDSSLYQIQVSYFAPNKSWINSPGYPSNRLASSRPIQERCLECHVTFAKSTKGFNRRNIYYKSQMMYGIDCERCHGTALEHVSFHLTNPKDTMARNLVKHNSLTRQQKLDACALCHSGLRMRGSENAFSFVLGDTLNRFSIPDYTEKSLEKLDVHGNQYGLLSASKCFKKSETLNCTTCHSPHENERNNHISFNKKCQSCHSINKNTICSESKETKKVIGNNCIQCHMPLVSSKAMRIETSKDTLESVQVRTHFIGIYSDSLVSK